MFYCIRVGTLGIFTRSNSSGSPRSSSDFFSSSNWAGAVVGLLSPGVGKEACTETGASGPAGKVAGPEGLTPIGGKEAGAEAEGS